MFDVTDGAATLLQLEALLAEGPIQVVVNNAGYGLVGAIEEVSPAEAEAITGSRVSPIA